MKKVKFDTNCLKVRFQIAELLGQTGHKTVLNNALTVSLTLFQSYYIIIINFKPTVRK